MDNFDERGYIKVLTKSGKFKGYLAHLDYGTFEYEVCGDKNQCKRYMQEDLLFHDIMLLQGYCNRDGDLFTYVMPYCCM